MKNQALRKGQAAFSLIELLLVIATLLVVFGLFYSGWVKARRNSQSNACIANLRSISMGFRIWADDNTNAYPVQIAVEFGGTREFTASGETFRHFEVLSNSLTTPKTLRCPADRKRKAKANFDPSLSNRNVSYFVGIDATPTAPNQLLVGDRNILGGINGGSNLVEISSTNGVGWGTDLHRGMGYIVMADGSVQGMSSLSLRQALQNTGLATNRLAMP